MSAGGARIATGVLVIAAGCSKSGSGGLPASGTDVSCPASTYILNGACTDLPPFSDASIVFDDGADASDDAPSSEGGADSGASNEGGVANDGGLTDAGGDAEDSASAPSDPLAPCALASDVFSVSDLYQGLNVGTATYTNAGATFLADPPPPLEIAVTPTGGAESLFDLVLVDEFGVPTGVLPRPGTYQTGRPGIALSLYIDGEARTYDSATVTIDGVQTLETDGGPLRLHSLLLSYALVSGQIETIAGCVRYVEDAQADGGSADAGAALDD